LEPNLLVDGENLLPILPLRPLRPSLEKEPRTNLTLKLNVMLEYKKFLEELLKNVKFSMV